MKSAFRSLAKVPGFTAVAVLTLALGIGTMTTAFSWIERVLLSPLPGVANTNRVIALETLSRSAELIDTSFPDFLDYQAQAKTLSAVIAFKDRPLTLGSGPAAERVWGELVSGDFFSALGARPKLGRFFGPDDQVDSTAATPAVVLSESLWQRRFQGDPRVVGRTVKLNQQDFTVIGVAPASFLGTINGLAFDVWVPVGTHARLLGPSRWLETRSWRSLHLLARLAPGATLADARAEVMAIAGRLALANPTTNRGIGLAAMPIRQSPHGAQRLLTQPLLLLLGVASLVLLIVCANLANLLLVRATARQREMCIRQALGAGMWRLVGSLLGESLLLSLAGATVGLFFTAWMSDLLRHFIPTATLPISLTSELSVRVLVMAVGLSTLTTLLAGLAPALWAARPNLIDILRTGGRAAATTPHAEFFRRALVVGQVTIAVVTLACAALATKSFLAAKRTHPGFEAPGVLLGTLKLDTSGYTRDQALAFLERLGPELAALPGVTEAAIAENAPLGLDRGPWEMISVPGYVSAPSEDLRTYRNLVSPGYFALMRIPLLEGREFNGADRRGATPVAIVNETFARRYFARANAVGGTFKLGARSVTIVGVARDTKIHQLGEAAKPYFYLPLQQSFNTDTGLGLHLRVASGDPLALVPAMRAAVHRFDPNVAVFEVLTLEDFIRAARFMEKTAASLLGVLSAIALGLTSLGLYGVLAFTVAQRTAEIGVRLALGAQPADIARLVLARGLALLAIGVGVGLLAAAAAARGLAAFFYGVAAFEPLLLAAAIMPVAATALLACWLPARRAAHVSPIEVLRAE